MKQSCDVAIIGAGPYGLSLAAHLKSRGIDFRIFGKPMDTWNAHMPEGMMLKSEGFASNLSTPQKDSSIKAFYAQNGWKYADQGLPISLDNYLAYTDSFRSRFIPDVEETLVRGLTQTANGFAIELDTGETLLAANVVLAVGVSHYAFTPEVLSRLPTTHLSHSYDHKTVSSLAGKDVTIIGAGSSAIDLAHALDKAGASPRIVARVNEIQYNSTPDPDMENVFYRLQNPPSTIGRGWRSYFCAEAPLLFYRLPKTWKKRAIESHLHPAAGWFMREQVEGKIPMMLGRNLRAARMDGSKAVLTVRDKSGMEQDIMSDHIIAATGYRVNLAQIPFMDTNLRNRIALLNTSPDVSDNFETSVSGLYAIGLSAMESFGPLMRFMVGSEFVAPRLAAHLDRTVSSVSVRRAA